ncbi:hypothetical protein [Pseudomonas sp. v388]|uniref:hypothetical protein n=1 Tax=Pseudomonas sp. v388 TaxID=2479849 RepID=UPI000F7A84F0|nr:hypothetical protein [Pseudomonas sp. v388]
MADNSLKSLLAWMKDPASEVMWKWDAIAALARGKVNRLLIQEYIARFTNGSYLPPISAGIETVGDQWQEYIHDFVLDAPRLSFEVETTDGAEFVKAVLTMSVMGGSQISMEKNVDYWQTAKVNWISPLQGPRLFLDLYLEHVPGVVKEDGRVYLDLRFSDNFRLTFGSTANEQRLGGAFFQELFNALPDEKRIYLLGSIEEGGIASLRPQSFKLGAQSNRLTTDEGFGDGSVLVFIQMTGSVQGGMPGADYRYLIPDDQGADYSATVLFARERVQRVAPVAESVLPLVSQLLGSDDFDLVRDAEGNLTSASSNDGGVRIEAVSFARLGPFHWENAENVISIRIDAPAMRFPANAPFSAAITANADNTVTLRWSSRCDEHIVCVIEEFPHSRPPFGLDYRFNLTLEVRYGMGADDSGGLVVRPLEFNYQLDHYDDASAASGKFGPPDPWHGDFLIALQGWLAIEFLDIEPRIRAELDKFAQMSVPLDGFIDDCIQLNFGHSITDSLIQAPRDIGAFGRVNPLTTAIAVDPIEPRLYIGSTQQFSVTPPTPVSWTVEHLLRSADNPGTINADGLYSAPPGVAASHLRVRVTAEAENGFKSSALVTILPSRLTVNPLICLCDPESTVALEAGTLNGGAVTWALVTQNPDSGTLTPDPATGRCIYTSSKATTTDSFVLDEIKVSGEGDSTSVYVLVGRTSTVLTLKPDPEAVLPQGQVQLRAWVIKEVEATWSLPLGGPGSIDAKTGLYISDPNALHRYVLVHAERDSEFGLYEGHIILPLPLSDFSEALSLMSL